MCVILGNSCLENFLRLHINILLSEALEKCHKMEFTCLRIVMELKEVKHSAGSYRITDTQLGTIII